MNYICYTTPGGGEFVVYDCYRPLAPIGTGAYGEVYAFTHVETGEKVAIKKIPNAFNSRTTASRTLREILLLLHIHHDNIVTIKDLIIPSRIQDFHDVYIVSELMDADLHQVLKSMPSLEDTYCQFFIYQLLRGLKYLHSGNILHRDLKPSNILVNLNDCMLKICDFGLARSSSEEEFLTEYVVTRPYRAPELLLGSRMYTGAVDLWSAGCVFVEMLTGKTLFPSSARQEHPVNHLKLIAEVLGSPDESDLAFLSESSPRTQIQAILSGHVRRPLATKFPNVSPVACDLAERMLVFNPAKRITAFEALEHAYLSSLHDATDEPACHISFDYDCCNPCLTMEQIKDLIWKEAVSLNSGKLR